MGEYAALCAACMTGSSPLDSGKDAKGVTHKNGSPHRRLGKARRRHKLCRDSVELHAGREWIGDVVGCGE